MDVGGLGGRGALSIEVQRDIFLIFKESLHNIRRHAGAGEVVISLNQSGSELCLRIADDGIGFDPAVVRRGQGLANLEHRARACRGRFTLEAAPGRGTVLTFTIPMAR